MCMQLRGGMYVRHGGKNTREENRNTGYTERGAGSVCVRVLRNVNGVCDYQMCIEVCVV